MSLIYLSKIGDPQDGIKFICYIAFLFIDKQPTMWMVQIHRTHPASGAVVTLPAIRQAGGDERWSPFRYDRHRYLHLSLLRFLFDFL